MAQGEASDGKEAERPKCEAWVTGSLVKSVEEMNNTGRGISMDES